MSGPLDHARGWLRRAESDRAAAERLIAAGGPLHVENTVTASRMAGHRTGVLSLVSGFDRKRG